MRQGEEEGEGRQLDGIEDCWVVVGGRGFDEIGDKLGTGGEEEDGRLTICQAAVGRQEWGREAIVGKSSKQPSFPPT